VPTLLSDPEARAAYDRLAAAKFRDHLCQAERVPGDRAPAASAPISGLNIRERAHALMKRGYKPKDAVALVLQEMEMEYSSQPRVMEAARNEAEDFLNKIRRGLI
jgi:hypothetical protein